MKKIVINSYIAQKNISCLFLIFENTEGQHKNKIEIFRKITSRGIYSFLYYIFKYSNDRINKNKYILPTLPTQNE